jgi:RNA polymerase sigma-70 factor, ECF subfamily
MQSLYIKYGSALRRKAERLLNNTYDAQDLVQELFMDLWRRNSDDVDLPYLYRALTNRCLNHLRDNANRRRLLQGLTHGQNKYQPSAEGSVLDAQVLMHLINKLDRNHQEILVYHFYDGMGQSEIAALLGLDRKTVGKRLAAVCQQALKLQRLSEVGAA